MTRERIMFDKTMPLEMQVRLYIEHVIIDGGYTKKQALNSFSQTVREIHRIVEGLKEQEEEKEMPHFQEFGE